MMHKLEWLLLFTQLPATPSSLRVNVWRRLKNIGATSYQSGSWLMPRNSENEAYLQRLQLFIGENGASSQLFYLQSVDDATDQEIKQKFIEDREEEYQEALEQCLEYQNELKEEIEKGILTFIELEDNEQKYKRLERWIAKIRKRDFLDSDIFRTVCEECQTCHGLLREYARKVYEKEGIRIGDELTNIKDDDLFSGLGEEE